MPQPFADQFKSIPMSPNLGESLERAHRFARDQGHRSVTLEHLLLAFTEDPDASAVLEASTVDPVRLGTDVSGYLGRLLEDMRAENGMEPQTDAELLRVLHAAVQADQQSRRRHIDGAIVLAAVVGDAKSPAAGLLKAHGLTFEEAIRALQKASAKASAQARSKQFATPAPPASAPATSPAVADKNGVAAPSKPNPSLEPLNVREPQASGQSVDDILAAARARIQQRSSAMLGKAPDPVQSSPPPAGLDSEPPQLSQPEAPVPPAAPPPPEADELTEGPGPVAPPAPAVAPPPNTQSAAPISVSKERNSWTPPAPPVSPSARLPQTPPAPQAPIQRHQAGFPQRPLHPGEGPPRPPLPGRGGPGNLPSQRPQSRQRVPWPDSGEPTIPPRAAMPNGALVAGPAPGPRRPGQRTGGQGPLVETIPRRMRIGAASNAQVKISRDKVDGLILLLMRGRDMTRRPDAFLTRALSVRLRAPDGGFWIEPASPETQWVETASGLNQDEHISWRWTVTPQRRGRGRLVLVVTARTVGAEGLAAETSPPDRTIEVIVTGGRMRKLARWGGFLATLLLGAVLGRMGSEFWALGSAIFKRLVGG